MLHSVVERFSLEHPEWLYPLSDREEAVTKTKIERITHRQTFILLRIF